MKLILNIGLRRSTPGAADLTVREVLAALKNAGFLPSECTVRQSSTEQTAIVTVETRFPDLASLSAVSAQLDQDAIAVFDLVAKRGVLAGLRAALWGAFNPAAFLTHSGQALA